MSKNKSSQNRSDISVIEKVVLITGAFGFIGREICKNFLLNGANVIIAGHNSEKVQEVDNEYSREFSKDKFLVCDLDICYPDSIERCMQKALKKFNKIDVLINNAALDAKFDSTNVSKVNINRFENYPVELIKQSIDVNITGTVQITQVVCRQMLKQDSGNIINMTSIYGLISPNQQLYHSSNEHAKYKPVDYVITKSFIPNYTRYLATLYAKNNIRCNAIAPGGVYNNHNEEFIKNYAALCPAGRMADKSELSSAFVFLASDTSKYITGITLIIDGGWSAW